MARERLPKRTPEEERATAIHEAGHAVIARVLGLVCGNVTIGVNYRTRTSGYGIIADPRVANDCWEQRGRYPPLEAAFRGRILAYMAGREAEEELLSYCQGGDADDQYQIALCPHTSWRQPFFNMMNGHGGSQTPALLKPPIRHCDRGVQAARRHSCSHRGKIGPGCLAAKFHDRQAQRKGESSSAYAALVAEPGLTNCTHEPNGSIM